MSIKGRAIPSDGGDNVPIEDSVGIRPVNEEHVYEVSLRACRRVTVPRVP